jgi:hypothetical protein
MRAAEHRHRLAYRRKGDAYRKVVAERRRQPRPHFARHQFENTWFPARREPAAKALKRVGDKAAHGVWVAEYAVRRLDLARDFVGLDAALREKAAIPFLALGGLIPGHMKPADIGGRQREFELALARSTAQQHVLDNGFDDAFRIDRYGHRDAQGSANRGRLAD